MRFLVLLDWNDMQFAMPHTVGGHHLVRKKPDILNGAAQDRNFKAIVVIHMHMHARQR